jgi:hypothetical protein
MDSKPNLEGTGATQGNNELDYFIPIEEGDNGHEVIGDGAIGEGAIGYEAIGDGAIGTHDERMIVDDAQTDQEDDAMVVAHIGEVVFDDQSQNRYNIYSIPDVIISREIQKGQSVVYPQVVYRLRQREDAHEMLRSYFFSRGGLNNMLRHLRLFGATQHETHYRSIRIRNLETLTVRFASFYFYKPPDDIVKSVYLIETIPINFYSLNLDTNNEYFVTILQSLLFKISREIHYIGLDPGHYTISLDVYYERGPSFAGKFHRDPSEGSLTKLPKYVSLEFFAPPNRTYLATELIFSPTQPPQGVETHDPEYIRGLVASETNIGQPQSMRLLVQDRSIIIFDNELLIHATPIVRRGDSPFDENTPFDDPNRAENTADPHLQQICQNTRNERRSYIRSVIQKESRRPDNVRPDRKFALPLAQYDAPGVWGIPQNFPKYFYGGEKNNDLISLKINPSLNLIIRDVDSIDPIDPKYVKEYIEGEKQTLKLFASSFEKGVQKRRTPNKKTLKNPSHKPQLKKPSHKPQLKKPSYKPQKTRQLVQGGSRKTKGKKMKMNKTKK